MNERTLQIADAYWAHDCGCEVAELRPSETSVQAHRGNLIGNSGIWILVVGDHPRVSLPDALLPVVGQSAKSWTKSSVQDPTTFEEESLSIREIIGPAFIGYTTHLAIYPGSAQTSRELEEGDRSAFQRFQSSCDPRDWDHGGSALGGVPTFGVFDENGDLVSLAGYRVWNENIAHISIITSRSGRGRGAGTAAVAKAAQHASEAGLVPQFRTLKKNTASMQIAAKLGFEEYGFSVYLKLG